MNEAVISESVQVYYGQVLQSSKDLKTSACCTLDAMPAFLRPLLADLHPEVVAKFYGCGSPCRLHWQVAPCWIWAAAQAGIVTCCRGWWGSRAR